MSARSARAARADRRRATRAPESGCRPILSNYDRYAPADITRVAVFVVPLSFDVRDGRPPEAKTVSGCEGASCSLEDRQ
jgi:hypothetical protein